MQRTDYQRISNNLTAAVDTGNRDAADEAFAEALLADGKTIDAAQFEEISDDYYAAIAAGEV